MPAPVSQPVFQIKVQTAADPMSGGGSGRTSIIETDGTTWIARNQGFGNPPVDGSLDAKLGQAVLAAANEFMASDPTLAGSSDAHKGMIFITKNGVFHPGYTLDDPRAASLAKLVFNAANAVPYARR